MISQDPEVHKERNEPGSDFSLPGSLRPWVSLSSGA
jgi:hypothetical protein